MTDKIISEAVGELSSALALTRNAEEIEDFLGSLLTKAELRAVAARWALVKAIAGGMHQRDIAKRYSLSLCKITRGSRELKKENSPFRLMLERLKKQQGK
jgi:TrpR family trp operon transcriptional repressor